MEVFSISIMLLQYCALIIACYYGHFLLTELLVFFFNYIFMFMVEISKIIVQGMVQIQS